MPTISDAPKQIWAFHNGPLVGYFVGKEEIGAYVSEYILAAEHERIVAEWRSRAEFAEAQLEGLLEMLPPPEPGLLKKRLQEIAAIRALAEKG